MPGTDDASLNAEYEADPRELLSVEKVNEMEKRLLDLRHKRELEKEYRRGYQAAQRDIRRALGIRDLAADTLIG